jgi:hypothetical protein
MLEVDVVLSFSPSAFQASLQTSNVQAVKRANGVAMSLIKKSDVKNHLSGRFKNRIHVAPASQPDATGFSGTDQAPATAKQARFAHDFTGDHTTPAESAVTADIVVGITTAPDKPLAAEV